ncbi:hypothetical protein AbraIFM66950_002734 [Aspergillus brasiliensis]|nr:hypothetical protein AbraIFM66950_002734 [Aspergillus brasiliensis]
MAGDSPDGQNPSNEGGGPRRDSNSGSEDQPGTGSEGQDEETAKDEGRDTHRDDEPAKGDEYSNPTDDANPPASAEPGATHSEIKPETSTEPPTTLESKGFEEFWKKIEVAKGNTSNLSKKIRKLEQEKSGLVERNMQLERDARRLKTYIKYLETQVESANDQLHTINALMESL